MPSVPITCMLLNAFNSIDNNGMKIISTVHYCDPDFACPYDNAFWNGEQMVYGDAYSYPWRMMWWRTNSPMG